MATRDGIDDNPPATELAAPRLIFNPGRFDFRIETRGREPWDPQVSHLLAEARHLGVGIPEEEYLGDFYDPEAGVLHLAPLDGRWDAYNSLLGDTTGEVPLGAQNAS